MKLIKMGLRSGKTTEAIKLANETGAYLVCLNRDEACRIREECNRNPVSFEELNRHGMRGSLVRNIVVDNFDKYFSDRLSEALQSALSPLDGLRIEGITFADNPENVATRVVGNILKRYLGEVI